MKNEICKIKYFFYCFIIIIYDSNANYKKNAPQYIVIKL